MRIHALGASSGLTYAQMGQYAAKPDAPGPGGAVEITGGKGIRGMINWRRDGKELYYLDADDNISAVEISTTPSFRATGPIFGAGRHPVGIREPPGLPGLAAAADAARGFSGPDHHWPR